MSCIQTRLWFDAQVRPNRSLSPQGLRRLLLATGMGGFVAGLALLASGQWIAAGFLWLDLALLAFALLASTAKLRAVEHVRIDDSVISIIRETPGRPREAVGLPAAWTRVVRVPHRQVEGLEAIQLTASGRTITIAAALAPWERPSFADALEDALARRRVGLRQPA